MKKLFILIGTFVFLLSGCIIIEDEPLVTVDPLVDFNAHIRNDIVYVTATINANPAFLNAGNIPVVFVYEGELEIYNEITGDLLNSTTITGDALSSNVQVSTDATNFDKFVIIATGTISAYADKESDGDSSNDLFLHSSDFYEVVPLRQVINIEDYPVVILEPSVDFQLHIKNSELFSTVTVRANPYYVETGAAPIIFDYNGVMQLYDEDSGALLKSTSLSGDGLANAVTLAADTATFNGFVIIASGTISCSADIESDGDPSNDLFISSAEYHEVLVVDLEEELP